MMQMLGVFAEFERASIIERVVMGMTRKAAEGKWVGGPEPYGYRRVPGAGRLATDTAEAAVVQAIFECYTVDLAGSHEIARRLNDQGHRTRSGRLFSYKSVLTILRNRVYLGEVGFKGTWQHGEHDAVVERSVFDQAQVLLAERGENPAKRAAHGSDYLLTGLVVCSCGARYTGTAATGRSRSYRYYTCGARQRHGAAGCQAQRLPADTLDHTITKALLDLLGNSRLLTRAVEKAKRQAGARADSITAELAAVDTELRGAEDAIDRYLRSFETGTLPEELCAPRVRALHDQTTALRTRRQQLAADQQTATATPDPAQLADLRHQLDHAIRHGTPAQVKALIHALVHEIRVEGPHTIRPTYKIPVEPPTAANHAQDAVRAPTRVVVLASHNTNRQPIIAGETVDLR